MNKAFLLLILICTQAFACEVKLSCEELEKEDVVLTGITESTQNLIDSNRYQGLSHFKSWKNHAEYLDLAKVNIKSFNDLIDRVMVCEAFNTEEKIPKLSRISKILSNSSIRNHLSFNAEPKMDQLLFTIKYLKAINCQ